MADWLVLLLLRDYGGFPHSSSIHWTDLAHRIASENKTHVNASLRQSCFLQGYIHTESIADRQGRVHVTGLVFDHAPLDLEGRVIGNALDLDAFVVQLFAHPGGKSVYTVGI